MGTSGNPAKRAAASSVADFKKRKKGMSIELPSGLVAICRRVEIRTFLQQGDVPNALLPIVEEALNKGKGIDIDEVTGLGKGQLNLDLVGEMYEMVDKVVMSVCVEPQVLPVPEDEADRDDDLLYVDELDDEDKMFLFQWSSGGTADLATFRREAEASLVSLAEGQGNRD